MRRYKVDQDKKQRVDSRVVNTWSIKNVPHEINRSYSNFHGHASIVRIHIAHERMRSSGDRHQGGIVQVQDKHLEKIIRFFKHSISLLYKNWLRVERGSSRSL
jgi:hypothetical protein